MVSVVGISVTMPYHIHEAAEIIQKIRSHPELNEIKILVGGFVFNSYPDLYIKVGADAYARSAEEAVRISNMHIIQSSKGRSCNQ